MENKTPFILSFAETKATAPLSTDLHKISSLLKPSCQMGQQNKAFPLAFCQRTLPLPFDPTALDPAPPVLTCGLHSGCTLAAPGPCRPLGSSSVMSLAQRPFLASGALSNSLLKLLGLFPSGLPQECSPLLPRLHCLYNSVFPCPAPPGNSILNLPSTVLKACLPLDLCLHAAG